MQWLREAGRASADDAVAVGTAPVPGSSFGAKGEEGGSGFAGSGLLFFFQRFCSSRDKMWLITEFCAKWVKY